MTIVSTHQRRTYLMVQGWDIHIFTSTLLRTLFHLYIHIFVQNSVYVKLINSEKIECKYNIFTFDWIYIQKGNWNQMLLTIFYINKVSGMTRIGLYDNQKILLSNCQFIIGNLYMRYDIHMLWVGTLKFSKSIHELFNLCKNQAII